MDFILKDHTREQMSKGLRSQAATEDMEGDRSPSVSEHEAGMLAMFRALIEEQRKSDDRREAARVERESEATRLQIEQQKVLEARQYEQQVALLKIQAEMGEKASRAHREMQSADRKRDRALFSIPVLKEGEDLEEFLLTAEGRLRAAEIKQDEWVSIMDSRLSGKVASAWRDITITVVDYQEARGRLLTMCGYTPRIAADSFFGFKTENSRGLTADQLYHRGQQLLRRMIAPGRQSEEVEFAILRGWVGTVITRSARAALDARVVKNSSELINALQDFLVLGGDRSEEQTAIFGKGGGETSKERSGFITCYNCGKIGHKAIDCWQSKGGATGLVDPSSSSKVIKCFTCGEEGHKSPQCPKIKKEKGTAEPKPLRRIKGNQGTDTVLTMAVNGQKVPVLLDSGSTITVVPETMVAQAQKTGDKVALRAFGAKQPLLLPMAKIPFEVGPLRWVESVALAPVEEGVDIEVVYGLNLMSRRGIDLVILANEGNPDTEHLLTDLKQAREDSKGEKAEIELEAEAAEQPNVESSRSERICEESTGEGVSVADRPAETPKPAASEDKSDKKRSKAEGLVEKEENGRGDLRLRRLVYQRF